MAISVNPSLYLLLVMVAVMLFLMVRNTRQENRKVCKIFARIFFTIIFFFQLSMDLEVSSTVLLQSEEMAAVCKADLSSQEQAREEMEVVKETRMTELENIIEKVKVCTEELEDLKINSVSNKTNSRLM